MAAVLVAKPLLIEIFWPGTKAHSSSVRMDKHIAKASLKAQQCGTL